MFDWIPAAPVDENTVSMIDLLQEHLRLAREGKLTVLTHDLMAARE